MHCSQVSSGASQAYAAQAAQGRKAAGCGEAKPVKSNDGCGESKGCDDAPRAARNEGRPARNPLVAAMMEALKGLVPAGSAPAATDTGEASAPSAQPASKDQAKALKEAAFGFATELFQALRSVGGDVGRGASGYGALAQGLQRLAQTVAPAAAPTASTPAPAAAVPTVAAAASSSAAATPEATPAVAPAPAAVKSPTPELVKPSPPAAVLPPAATSAGITINFTINIGGGLASAAEPSSAPAATQEDSPLLAAFKRLMLALNPKADATGAVNVADAKKPAELLQAFLQQIAKALGADTSMAAGDALPAKGSLINLTA
jgi:hypothetical protein